MPSLALTAYPCRYATSQPTKKGPTGARSLTCPMRFLALFQQVRAVTLAPGYDLVAQCPRCPAEKKSSRLGAICPPGRAHFAFGNILCVPSLKAFTALAIAFGFPLFFWRALHALLSIPDRLNLIALLRHNHMAFGGMIRGALGLIVARHPDPRQDRILLKLNKPLAYSRQFAEGRFEAKHNYTRGPRRNERRSETDRPKPSFLASRIVWAAHLRVPFIRPEASFIS